VAVQLDRPITVFDVIRSTRDWIERERRVLLVRQLRVRKHRLGQSSIE